MKKAPDGFYYDPSGDLTQSQPVKGVWIQSNRPIWFWQKETFDVRLEYESGEGWKWEFGSYDEAAEYRDLLIESMQAADEI